MDAFDYHKTYTHACSAIEIDMTYPKNLWILSSGLYGSEGTTDRRIATLLPFLYATRGRLLGSEIWNDVRLFFPRKLLGNGY